MGWVYRQNTLVYCAPTHVPAGFSPVTEPVHLDYVDPGMVEALVADPASIRDSVKGLSRNARALLRATAARLRRERQRFSARGRR